MEKKPTVTREKAERAPVKVLLLDMNDVCAAAGIDRATGWRWLKAGILPKPAIKAGRVVRWNADLIAQWAGQGIPA